MPRQSTAKNGGANLGFEATLWAAADKMRNNMDAAEYKHVVLGLMFLKYISDAFEEQHAKLAAEKDANPEDRDEYLAVNCFWVPVEARWSFLKAKAKQPTIGKFIDDAMIAIERDNPVLKQGRKRIDCRTRQRRLVRLGFARQGLDKQRLGELVDLISTIGLGDKANRSKDVLGQVYMDSRKRHSMSRKRRSAFLREFAAAEGRKGGQFWTPQCVVQLLVAVLAPFKGRVFDPCCGTGGMFVQSENWNRLRGHGQQTPTVSCATCTSPSRPIGFSPTRRST